MQRQDFIQKTADTGKLISGLLVLLLVLVWQAAPAFRQSRAGALPDRAVSARVMLPPDAMKSHQSVLAAKAGDDRMTDGPPIAGLLPVTALDAPMGLAPTVRSAAATAAGRPRALRPQPRAPPAQTV